VTENGNIILDCEFGEIFKPRELATKLIEIPGVIEVGIFSKPHIIYKAKKNGQFEVLR
jgi:ribose 5-phosphate isomerase A